MSQFDLTDEQREIQELARRFTADRITPFADEWDETHHFPRDVVVAAAEAGIVFNEGPAWAVSPANSSSHLRLCFAMPSKETIREGVAALAKVCFQETGIPKHSGNVRHAG